MSDLLFSSRQSEKMGGIIKIVKRILKIMTIIICSVVVVVLLALGVRLVARQAILSNSIKNNEISELQQVNLNGYNQTILVEGKSKDSPVLIILHGGPGSPIPFGIAYRDAYPELTEKYILVQWDQYGCGYNYHSENSAGIHDYQKMAYDLVVEMKSQFPDNELYIFAMSWGTILSAYLANEAPEFINGIVAYAPFSSAEMERQNYAEVLSELNLTEEEQKIIEKALTSTELDDYHALKDIANKYTNSYFYNGKEQSNSSFKQCVFRLLYSPDYSLQAIYNIFFGTSAKRAMSELITLDATVLQENIRVPYLILKGEEDLLTSQTHIEYLVSINPNITFESIPNSGHIPTNPCMERILEILQTYAGE